MSLFDSLFSKKSGSIAGLDVSTSSVKLVELSQDRPGSYTVEHCAIEPLERGWITDGNIEKFDEVVEAVRRTVRKSGTRAKRVTLALPASVVITKKIVLPDGLSERELEIYVESEANQYIPFSLDEVSLDFCVLGPSQASAGDIDVMIAAARKEKVEDCRGLAEAAGLEPVVVDVETYASRLAAKRLIERLPGQGKDALVVLFEIGASLTSMQVLRNDELIYERDQVFGGAQLTQMLVRQYGFTFEEAEAKKRSGDLPDDYATTVLQPFVETLAIEIERALKFFFTSTPHNRVDAIFLAGGTASLAGLAQTIAQHASVPCQVVNPFDGMNFSRNMKKERVMREAASYLTAAGLAIRGLVS